MVRVIGVRVTILGLGLGMELGISLGCSVTVYG